jgi:hypothetical protein
MSLTFSTLDGTPIGQTSIFENDAVVGDSQSCVTSFIDIGNGGSIYGFPTSNSLCGGVRSQTLKKSGPYSGVFVVRLSGLDPSSSGSMSSVDYTIGGCGGGASPGVQCPTGESTSWDRWGIGNRATQGYFNATLLPTDGSFDNLIVRERNGNPGGGGSGKDTCWCPTCGPKKYDHVTGGQWTIGKGTYDPVGHNQYGQDVIGWTAPQVHIYRILGRAPCGTEFEQIMEFFDPGTGNWIPYGGKNSGNKNTIKVQIGVDTVTVSRGGQTKTTKR